ncbi:MAG: pyridoxamine 5'-phosphate oxidase family protein [Cyanobacteriota bacterium]|nr:pyridoxamine 5'-phosphate oxidase family protein [Cyanobacteriota bacterium]
MGEALPLPPWRPLLRGAREREGRSGSARWLQLATVAADGTPRVRTLVFRGWAGPACLDLLSDARSAKIGELASQPAVELLWLLPKARTQFRLRGHCSHGQHPDHERDRLHHWHNLSPAGRALWGWPAPGEPREPDDASFVSALPAEAPVPNHFALLRIALQQVEMLQLGPHPHQRVRWRSCSGWEPEPLNP